VPLKWFGVMTLGCDIHGGTYCTQGRRMESELRSSCKSHQWRDFPLLLGDVGGGFQAATLATTVPASRPVWSSPVQFVRYGRRTSVSSRTALRRHHRKLGEGIDTMMVPVPCLYNERCDGSVGGRQFKRWRAQSMRRRVGSDWRLTKVQPQQQERAETARESPSLSQNRRFSF
jgi:hypothetical protein